MFGGPGFTSEQRDPFIAGVVSLPGTVEWVEGTLDWHHYARSPLHFHKPPICYSSDQHYLHAFMVAPIPTLATALTLPMRAIVTAPLDRFV